jgi:uncharacterized repeat protein (TIGR01451 family)
MSGLPDLPTTVTQKFFRRFAAFLFLFASGATVHAQTPAISSFTPISGPPGTQVTINGSGFSSVTQVRFGEAIADFTALSASQIVAIVPTNATSAPLHATSASGTGDSAANFTVPPRISDFSPPLGAPGTPVVINGANFTNATAVRFNGLTAAFSITGESQISATVPNGATDGPITVVTTVGSVDTATNFIASSRPIVTDVTPLVGIAGDAITVSGANFTGTLTVRFNGVAATSVTQTGQGTQLRVVVPAGATTGPITVTTANGTATNSLPFITGTQPIITDFSPALGSVGDAITINGLNFLGGTTTVKFNGKTATVSALSATSLQAFVPSGATTGPITVTTSAGTGTGATNFITGTAPIITDISPAAGSPGEQIVISGLNFTAGGLVVRFNGVTDATATATAPGQILARVPAGATTGRISVTTSAGSATNSTNFFVTGTAPFIIDFTPGSGPRSTPVTITGAKFTGATAVRFNGILAPAIAVTSDSQIQTEVPAGARTGAITVASPVGTGTSTATFYAPPRITAVAPAGGVAGTALTITGTNFTAATSLTFASTNGTRLAVGFTIVSDTQITTVVPTNALTGPLVLAAPGGVIYSAAAFAVLPRVDSFSPTLGPAGTSVTIRGQNFANATAVRFNGANAAFAINSTTQLTATVPVGATTGIIAVANADGSTASTASFLVTRPTDLAITQSNSPAIMLQNQPGTFFIAVTNKGPSTVTGVTVTDVFPSGMQFISATTSQGTFAFSGGTFACNLGILSNATSATITLTIFNTTAGVPFHQVSVASIEGDVNSSDNLSQALVAAVSDAQRTLTITPVPDAASVQIRWPFVNAPVTFLLQSATNLAPGYAWTTVAQPPALVTNNAIVYNSITQSTAALPFFFRLKSP